VGHRLHGTSSRRALLLAVAMLVSCGLGAAAPLGAASAVVQRCGGAAHAMPCGEGVRFTVTEGPLGVVAPASLNWTATLDGYNQAVVDTNAADMKYSVFNMTGTGAGWAVTAKVMPLAGGAGPALPATLGFATNGDPSDNSSTKAPTSTCATASRCIPAKPRGTVAFPVGIPSTASHTAPPAVIYDAAPGSGMGAVVIGKVGWWLNIPANTKAGAYTSTITLTLTSGPTS
jgi:hypothetical protein